MRNYRKLTHVHYKCDHHIVFTPKYRFQILEGMVKSLVEHNLQLISSWKDVQVIELNVQKSYIHLVCSIHSTKGFNITVHGKLKGEMAIKLFKTYPNLKQKHIGATIFGQEGIL